VSWRVSWWVEEAEVWEEGKFYPAHRFIKVMEQGRGVVMHDGVPVWPDELKTELWFPPEAGQDVIDFARRSGYAARSLSPLW